jgi:hypothetical protein
LNDGIGWYGASLTMWVIAPSSENQFVAIFLQSRSITAARIPSMFR